MLETLLRLLPVVLGIAVGVALRLLGVARSTDGEFVFRLVFSVCLPTLIFLSVSRVVVTPELALFAVAPLAFFAVGYLVGQLVGRTLAVTGGAVPVLVISCMVVNGSFALTFVQALFGADGVARIAVFDAVNAALTFTWASYTAARGNPGRAGGGARAPASCAVLRCTESSRASWSTSPARRCLPVSSTSPVRSRRPHRS